MMDTIAPPVPVAMDRWDFSAHVPRSCRRQTQAGRARAAGPSRQPTGTNGTSRRTRVCERFGPIDTQVIGVPACSSSRST